MVGLVIGFFLLKAGAHLKPLPARTKITIEREHMLPGYAATSMPCPSGHPLTKRQIRHIFATYHLLAEGEYHDGYAQMGCVTEGDIIVDGKKFRYMVQPINNLQTTWPDGENKLLGGKHSDDSASQ
jgi:hypothetical protein